MNRLVLFLGVTALSTAPAFAASDTPIDRESLRDLDGVRVAVDELPASAARFALSQDRLRKDIEDRLRAAGIRVANSGEFPVGDPALRLHLAIAPETKGIAAFTLELDFAQIVFLRRNPAVTFNRAQTWSAGAETGLAARAKFPEAVSRVLAAQTDRFIAAYRSVNPK